MKETMVTLLVFFLLFIAIVAAEFFLTGQMVTSEESGPMSQLFDIGEPQKEIHVGQK